MLLNCYTQYASKFGKLSSDHRTGKGPLVFIPIQKKGNIKECSNCHTIALISHASRVTLKIFQFLPGKFHGQRSLAVYSPQGLRELDMTEHTSILVVQSLSHVQLLLISH